MAWSYITRSFLSIFPPPLINLYSLPPLGGRVRVGGLQDYEQGFWNSFVWIQSEIPAAQGCAASLLINQVMTQVIDFGAR